MTMLKTNPEIAFDFDDVDFNWYVRSLADSGLLKNENATFDGTTYTDLFYFSRSDGDSGLELVLGGTGITADSSGRITGGSISGIVELDYVSRSVRWSMSGISLDAAALYASVCTPTVADERSLIEMAFSGPDSIDLSDQGDYAEGFASGDTLDGMGGDDRLFGGDGEDRLFGRDGDDLLDGGAGADFMVGGAGNDTYVITDAGDSTIELPDSGTDTVLLYYEYVLLGDNVENATVAWGLRSSIDGNSLNNTLAGGIANDVLSGNVGNDTLIGGGGIDTATFLGIVRSSAQVTRTSGGPVIVTSSSLGMDSATEIELYRFNDGFYSFAFGRPGTPVVSDFAMNAGGWSSQDRYPRHSADVNGDGYADIVGFGQHGILVSLGSANGLFGTAQLVKPDFGQAAGWLSDNAFHRELADINGDGRADIVGFGATGTLVSLAQAEGTFGDVIFGIADFGAAQGWVTQDEYPRQLGDVNGDGYADIVGFGVAGSLVSLGNGDGTFAIAVLGKNAFTQREGWSSDERFPRALGDVNGDGKDDIVGFGTAGTYVSLSNGDGTFGDPVFAFYEFGSDQGWTSQTAFARQVADVNGDGLADVIGFGQAGTYVAFGSSDPNPNFPRTIGPFFPAALDIADFGAEQGWTDNNITFRDLADTNNDGMFDVIGFGVDGVVIGLNQGDILF